jgi:hypothetical protein
LIYFEIIGALLSIIGAISMSFSTNINTKPIYYASIFYFLSNLFMTIFFTLTGKIPLTIQISFFLILSILSILKYTENLKRDKILLTIFIPIYIMLYLSLILVMGLEKINFTILPLDVFASILAASGSIVLLISKQNYKLRSYAYIFYFLADVLFVYIGFINNYYAFLAMSLIFIITSIISYYRTMGKEIKKFFNIN